MEIYTHVSVDLDACASVWAAKKYYSGAEKAFVNFRSARWNGAEMKENDLALDIDAGGKGIKGEHREGVTHSCFRLLMEKYAPKEDVEVLEHLILFVDIQDAYGSVVEHFFPESSNYSKKIISLTGINSVLRALQAFHQRNDLIVCEKMGEIFHGMLFTGRSRKRAETEAENAEIIENKVAITRNARTGTHRRLFEKGIQAVIYVDGHNLGIVKKNNANFRLDHPRIVGFL